MSFGPPRRHTSRPCRSERPTPGPPDLERKHEKLRQLANDRQSAWMHRREPDTPVPVSRSNNPPSSSLHLVAHINNSAGLSSSDRKNASSSSNLRPLARVNNRRAAWCDNSSQSNADEKVLEEQTIPERDDDLAHIADLAVFAAKSDAYHPGRMDRPESHFCRQCRRLMSLPGHNAMCLVPCAHTVCESCATKSLERCPVCDLPVRTTTFNVLLQKIIDRFSEEHGLVKKTTSNNYGEDLNQSRHQMSLEEQVGTPDYVPSSETINRWAEQLASVEMRLSVVDVQARELAKELINYKTRVQGHLSDIQKVESEEERLLKQLSSLSDDLELVRKQKERWMENVRLEKANEEKIREQLNLTNYTKAGLEAEVEKLRMLCNRKS